MGWREAALALLLMLFSASCGPSDDARPSPESLIVRAVYADGKLWTLSEKGRLSSIEPDRLTRHVVDRNRPVLELWPDGKMPWILSCSDSSCSDWIVERLNNGGWRTVARVPTRHEELIAAQGANGHVTIVTARRILDVESGAAVAISGAFRPTPFASVSAALATPTAVFLGFNAGEWGGGLVRIDRRTGLVRKLEKRSGDLCDGPLNTDCDPVNALIESPWNSNCILAAIGLMHMGSHGRITEICGDAIRRHYFRSLLPPFPGGKVEKDDDFSSVAFYGLAKHGDELWAVGIDGLYNITREGHGRVQQFPRFREADGVFVNFWKSDLVLVLTDANMHFAVSGSVPMMAVR
jgi:hypothetical protein